MTRLSVFAWGLIGCDYPLAVPCLQGLKLAGGDHDLYAMSARSSQVRAGDMSHLSFQAFRNRAPIRGSQICMDDVAVERDWEELLRYEEIDGFIICLPPEEAADAALQIAETGKHCILFPPASVCNEDIVPLMQAFAQSGGKLIIGQYLTAFQQYRHLLQLLNGWLPSLQSLYLQHHVPWKMTDCRGTVRKRRGMFFDCALQLIPLLVSIGYPEQVHVLDARWRHGYLQWVRAQLLLPTSLAVITVDIGAYRNESGPPAYHGTFPSVNFQYDGRIFLSQRGRDKRKRLDFPENTPAHVWSFIFDEALQYFEGDAECAGAFNPQTTVAAMCVIESIVEHAEAGKVSQ